LRTGRRVLAPTGTLYFHIDYREAHYCKLPGSGTLGSVAAKNGRGYVLIDESPEAVEVATRRLAGTVASAETATAERETIGAPV
jgi:DNA modification methylase